MKIKKICFLTSGQYPVPATEGGAVENLVEMLLADYQNRMKDCYVEVISLYSPKAQKVAKLKYKKINFSFIKVDLVHMKIYTFTKRVFKKIFKIDPVLFSSYFTRAVRIIKKNDYDIVVIENKPQFVVPLRRQYKGKIVLHLHNDTVNSQTDFTDKVLKNVDLVLTVSDYIKSRVEEINKEFKPVVTLHNIVDTDFFKRESALSDVNIRQKYGFLEDDIVLLYVGRLVPDKGIDKLIDAMEQVENEKVKLIIVGGSAYSDSVETTYVSILKEKADKLNGKVKFSGYVDYGNIPAFYYMCDIAVFPSQWEEPAGLVVVEAQACGKPVIISNSGGMSEFVSNDSAIVVLRGEKFVDEMASVIELLSDDAAKRENMGTAGKKVAEMFNKEGYFERFYEQLEIFE